MTFFVLRHMRWKPLIPSVSGIFLGVMLGIGLAGIGVLWSRRNASMLQSITYVVGNDLRSGGIAKLLFIALFTGITEEWPFRGWLTLLTATNYRWAGFVLFVALNYLWALGHITHIGPDARRSLRRALSRSRSHRLIVFLSGFPLAVLVLWTGSLVPAMVAHATLNFVFGLFYRRMHAA